MARQLLHLGDARRRQMPHHDGAPREAARRQPPDGRGLASPRRLHHDVLHALRAVHGGGAATAVVPGRRSRPLQAALLPRDAPPPQRPVSRPSVARSRRASRAQHRHPARRDPGAAAVESPARDCTLPAPPRLRPPGRPPRHRPAPSLHFRGEPGVPYLWPCGSSLLRLHLQVAGRAAGAGHWPVRLAVARPPADPRACALGQRRARWPADARPDRQPSPSGL
mmetsp:Transcript_10279/g.33980  ORF Transcript_10279/g.33980 Transcript_10279/m.33980 type:complete len:223 (-) Transcript_10279:541-1209(-)